MITGFQFDPAILETEALGPIYPDGERSILRRLMERRFGAIPDWAEARLATLSPEKSMLYRCGYRTQSR